ncbi:hypothetical protein P7K49_032456 [Saguinus oedipus]|uniref:Uncharacterized protein n=1 Tax=Saguinus oedipus TaxID=9490 RepID=A0ABQ9TZ37_SAGOE|nr:hypothetical protein P7K49_032456 [Saguinus oedipus]
MRRDPSDPFTCILEEGGSGNSRTRGTAPRTPFSQHHTGPTPTHSQELPRHGGPHMPGVLTNTAGGRGSAHFPGELLARREPVLTLQGSGQQGNQQHHWARPARLSLPSATRNLGQASTTKDRGLGPALPYTPARQEDCREGDEPRTEAAPLRGTAAFNTHKGPGPQSTHPSAFRTPGCSDH